MDLELEGKVAYVSGSSRGIGLATAKAFLREGASVILTGRSEDTLESAVAECQALSTSDRVLALSGDLTREVDIERTINKAFDRYQRLDVVVANIGSGESPAGWRLTPAQWTESLETNLIGAMALVAAAAPCLPKTGGGAVTFIGSIAGWESLSAPIAYSAAKAALLSAMKTLSRELGRSGVRINAVVPGNVLFPGGTWDRKLAEDRERVERYITAEVPLGRFGSAEEIADAAVFVSSARAAFVTGACLVIDGGQTRSW